jgi:hypothetical protein
VPFDLDLSQVTPLLANVRSVFTPQFADEMLLNAGRKVGVAAEGLVSAYPPASGNPLPLYYTRTHVSGPDKGKQFTSKFKSQAQQRLVMALVAKGKIPYRRSGTLGRSITSVPALAGSGVVIVHVGSNLSYAAYVIDKVMQSHYHIGTWTPLPDDIQRGLPQLAQVAVKSIVADANKKVSSHG